MQRKLPWPVSGLLLTMLVLPYVAAYFSGGDAYVFGGFLLNPQDGNTYLAKMEEGRQGDWLFTLPFSAEKGSGAFLFVFYLLLGHISRISGLPLLLIFHLARLLGALYLAVALHGYCAWVFEQNGRWAQRAFALALFGAGLGWTLIAFGLVTSDLWVAEAFPFLSSFINPHFPLGMGLLLQMFMGMSLPVSRWGLLRLAGMGLLLVVIMPFGGVVAGVVGGAWLLLEWAVTKQLRWQPFLAAFCLAGPGLIYQYWATLNDALLSAWNAQNITLAPPLWDFLISLSPVLLLAVFAIWQMLRGKAGNGFLEAAGTPAVRLQIVWLVVGAALIYFPFALQRRFMFAYYVPVSLLGVEGLRLWLAAMSGKVQRRGYTGLLALSVLTNGMLLVLVGFAVLSRSDKIFLPRAVVEGFGYLRGAAAENVVILCTPETGNLVPGWTGRRVLYGHEFETANAPLQKKLVHDLLNDEYSLEEAQKLLNQNNVQYVFLGPDARITPKFLRTLSPVYQNGAVKIYRWQ